MGEQVPGNYFLRGEGDDKDGNAIYSTAKLTQVTITANNDQTITLTF